MAGQIDITAQTTPAIMHPAFEAKWGIDVVPPQGAGATGARVPAGLPAAPPRLSSL
jgi:hypothetical protein